MSVFVALLSFSAWCFLGGAIDIGRRGRTEQFYMKTTDPDTRKEARLHTRVFFPKDFDDSGNTKYQAVIDRSPYGYSGLEWIADVLLPFGFVAVGQDMRGTGYSTGNFTIWHTDGSDGVDLGNWVTSQKWSNGIVFTFGASADGVASMTIPHNKPSWLGAQYVIWSSSNFYEILMPNSAYLYHLIQYWISGTVRPNDLAATFAEIYDNEAETDWWSPLDMVGKYQDLIHFPSGFWAGWYDIFLPGTLRSFDGYQYEAKEGAQGQSRLLVDPLGHCQKAAEFFPNSADLIYGRSLLSFGQMLEVYGVRPVWRGDIKTITFYVMSSNDEAGMAAANFWSSVDTWPEPKLTKFYLLPDGTASPNKQPAADQDPTDDAQSYVYDPSNPVLGVGGNNLPDHFLCGPQDQSDTEVGRTDVLQFETAVVGASDDPLYLTGPLEANLFVSSEAVDTDFSVKISDVYPNNGPVRLLIDNNFRMRWREMTATGNLEPVYMKSGEVYNINVNLWNTSYAVAPGHKLRISISSSNWPRFSVNPNNGLLLNDTSYPGQNITTTNTLYHSAAYPSSVSLPVVTKDQLPVVDDVHAEVAKMYPQLQREHLLPGGKYESLGRAIEKMATGEFPRTRAEH